MNNNNNESMANFICELRKANNMTQKQLAEKLNITDKAVSKWERGLGYPDITLLSPLAEILGVTANELLSGERSAGSPPKANEITETTIKYVKKVTVNKESAKRIAKIVITAACLIGILTCVICDIAISGKFTWSLYPISATVFGWLIVIPLFQFKQFGVRMSLISLSVFIIPFLFILNHIIGNAASFLSIGIPVSVIGVAFLWIIYGLFYSKKFDLFQIMSIMLLLSIPVSMAISYVISVFVDDSLFDIWDILGYAISFSAALFFFLLGRIIKKREDAGNISSMGG